MILLTLMSCYMATTYGRETKAETVGALETFKQKNYFDINNANDPVKRDTLQLAVPELEGEDLNYEFLYRAWEDLEGNRYGTKHEQKQRFHHREERKNGTTQGQYRFILPNGKIQIVSYKQMGNEYLAKVTYLPNARNIKCLGILRGCSLNFGDIDVGSFEIKHPHLKSEVHPIEQLPLSIKQQHLDDYQNVATPKPFYENPLESLPSVEPRFTTPKYDGSEITQYYPTTTPTYKPKTKNTRPVGLYKNVDHNSGFIYGVNNHQVAINYNYGNKLPFIDYDTFNDYSSEVKEPSTKRPLKITRKPYFDPVSSEEPVKSQLISSQLNQLHPEYFIPSKKVVNSFKHLNQFPNELLPNLASTTPFPIESKVNEYKNPNHEVDLHNHVSPTTYKPPYIPIFVQRPKEPIDSKFLHLPPVNSFPANNGQELIKYSALSTYGDPSGIVYGGIEPPPLLSSKETKNPTRLNEIIISEGLKPMYLPVNHRPLFMEDLFAPQPKFPTIINGRYLQKSVTPQIPGYVRPTSPRPRLKSARPRVTTIRPHFITQSISYDRDQSFSDGNNVKDPLSPFAYTTPKPLITSSIPSSGQPFSANIKSQNSFRSSFDTPSPNVDSHFKVVPSPSSLFLKNDGVVNSGRFRNLPTSPEVFDSQFVPSSFPHTQRKVQTTLSRPTIPAESFAPVFVRSSLRESFSNAKFNRLNTRRNRFAVYGTHSTVPPPLYPPLGNPNFKTSLIRFPDTKIPTILTNSHLTHKKESNSPTLLNDFSALGFKDTIGFNPVRKKSVIRETDDEEFEFFSTSDIGTDESLRQFFQDRRPSESTNHKISFERSSFDNRRTRPLQRFPRYSPLVYPFYGHVMLPYEEFLPDNFSTQRRRNRNIRNFKHPFDEFLYDDD